jgi:hypothetical protein
LWAGAGAILVHAAPLLPPAAVLLLSGAALLAPAPAHAASVIRGTTWFPIGPAPIDPGIGGEATGRAGVLAVNPFNQNEVWLGSASGGVWQTTDGGLHWTPLTDKTEALAIGAIALADCAPAGCARIYVGTGENRLRRDTLYGRGLLVGTPNPDQFPPYNWVLKGNSLFNEASIVRIALDTTTSGATQRIYVAVSSGVTASATESTITAPPPPMGYGIYKSEDNGDSWTKLTIPGTAGSKPTDLEIDPLDPDLLFAGFLGKGIFKGERDPMTGVIDWCALNAGTGAAVCMGTSGALPDATAAPFDFVEIALSHPSGPNPTLYAIFGNCPDPICAGCNPALYKSTNGGGHWTLKNAAAPYSYSRYTHALAIDPNDDDNLVYGGLGLFRSLNSGDNFDSNGDGLDDDIVALPPPNQIHPDQHDIVFANPGAACTFQQCNVPGNNCKLYVVDDGGFYVSTNSGCTWTGRNDGLQITGFQSISSSPLTARVIGGTQDNGTLMFTGASTWAYKAGGDTNATILDKDDANRMFHITLLSCNPQRVVERSLNGGAAWNTTYTTGSGEQAAFYPPMVQDPTPPHPIYLGTNRLYKSVDDAGSFVDVSPVLGGTGVPYPDIGRDNVITAIAVAPGTPGRIYVGYYDGQIWVTDGACSGFGCWTSVGGPGNGLPNATVTWLAVDPADEDTAYVAFSGFFSGAHVYKTTTGGASWSAASGAGMNMLPSVPANTIVVEPSMPTNVWAGLDGNLSKSSVWKSTDGGANWSPFGQGLPNVPVYELSILEREAAPGVTVGQVYAGTHGRGAFVLTQPFLSNFEGWIMGSIWDIPVYGNGFLPNESCTMQILQSDGTICAQGSVDAMGGTIQTDGTGRLTTTLGGFYSGQPVAWGCFVGTCLGGVPIAQCNDDASGDGIPDPLSTILVNCGGLTGIDAVLGCPQQNNPPSSILGLNTLPGSPVAAVSAAGGGRSNGTAGSRGAAGSAVGNAAAADDAGTRGAAWHATASGATPRGVAASSGWFRVQPTVQTGDGSTHILCAVDVPFSAGEETPVILRRAAEAVNADAVCGAAGVEAFMTTPGPPNEPDEDVFHTPVFYLEGPGVSGGQLLATVRTLPGAATGACFDLGGLGIPVINLLQVLRLRFETAAGGASGGHVRLVERSDLGACEVIVPTSPGASAEEVAKAVHQTLMQPGVPGPHPRCPAARNPRDTMHKGDSVITVMATGLTVCVEDPGLGFAVVPKETCFSDPDCDDGNPCTKETCDTALGRCVREVLPDGTACDDGDLCTEGGLCRNGVCGVPVRCDDQNRCTTDACDPATGRCVNRPACDDGNPCTRASCDAETGECRFDPEIGAACDDGDPCTAQDVCSFSPTGATAVCRGTPLACDDGDACTLDRCDPADGRCVNEPVVCGDGNDCTFDFCDRQTGRCLADPLTGAACDDGSLCTTDDVCARDPATGAVSCQGKPASCADNDACTLDVCDADTGACLHPPLSCDDGKACTLDRCDAAAGGCVHVPLLPVAVAPLEFKEDAATFVWPATPDAAHWNSYRGTIPPTMLGSRLPAGPVYDHACFESADAAGDGATLSVDRDTPRPGWAFYYGSSGESACGEGSLGRASSGVERPNLAPCPTPP